MKIIVSRAKFDEALSLYGMETYDHLIIEGPCTEHVWKMRTWDAQNADGGTCFAWAWNQCENCDETRDTLLLVDRIS